MPEVRPSIEQVRDLLASAHSPLADDEISFLDDGWDQWAFRAGDHVVRLPKGPGLAERLLLETRLTALLAPRLPLPIPRVELHETPTGEIFTTHRFVEGVPLNQLRRRPPAGFGAALGRFLRALHATPLQEALALGLQVIDGPRARELRIETYEGFVRGVFPLLGCEARSYAARVFETAINDARQYEFEPRLCHLDLDGRNTLADPETAELSGVIDFGDAKITGRAADYSWAYCFGFEQLGIPEQIPELLREGGIDEAELAGRCEFLRVWWPLDDIQHGLQVDDAELIEDAIRRLNAIVPRDLRC